MNQSTEFRKVVSVNVRTAKVSDTWFVVTLKHKDGTESEVTIWPSNGENVAVTFGEEE